MKILKMMKMILLSLHLQRLLNGKYEYLIEFNHSSDLIDPMQEVVTARELILVVF
jgi:hypothetical protein